MKKVMKGLAALIAACLAFASCTGTKEVTVDTLKAKDMKLGELIFVSASYGGGMEGGSEDATLELDGERGTITFTETLSNGAPAVVRSYDVPADKVSDMKKYVSDYNLAAWSELPESELEALDRPTQSISLGYDNSSKGGSSFEIYTVSFDDQLPPSGTGILNGVLEKLYAMRNMDTLRDAYVEGDDGEELRGSEAALKVLEFRLWMLYDDPNGIVVMEDSMENINGMDYFTFRAGTDNGYSFGREYFLAVRNDYAQMLKMDPLTGEVDDLAVIPDYTISFHKIKTGVRNAEEEIVVGLVTADIGLHFEAEYFVESGDFLSLGNRDAS